MLPPHNLGEVIVFSGLPAVCCPSIRLSTLISFDMSLLSEGTSIKLSTNVQHENWHCWKGLHVRKSNTSETLMHFLAEAYISTVWRQGSLVF